MVGIGFSLRLNNPSESVAMEHCCEKKTEELARLQGRQRRVLYTVLWINAAMFLIEGIAGVAAHSTALLADALDMLGDALVYGFTLFVLTRSARWQAGAAFSKGVFMMAFGLAVLGEAAYKVIHPSCLRWRRWAWSACWRWRRTLSAS